MSSTSTQPTWTDWFDGRPDADGDAELTDTILKKYGKICEKGYEISGTECLRNNVLYFNDTSPRSSVPDTLYYFCSKSGVWCRNRDQYNSSTTCGDYAIRYKCRYSESGTNSDSGMFPQFDVRIYIILAVVPILIFIARLLWTYVFRNRRQRRREERRARRRAQGRYDDDESSAAPGAAKPPPSYQDIFGEPGHFKTSVFAISRENLPICSTCRGLPCSVARVIQSGGTRSQKNSPIIRSTTITADPEAHNTTSSPNEDDSSTSNVYGNCDNSQVLEHSASEAVQESPAIQNKEDFVEIDLTTPSSSREGPAATSGAIQLVQIENELLPQGYQADGQASSSPQHSTEANSTVCLSISPLKLHASPLSISQPCPCVCHRTIPFSHYKELGYDNSAFSTEGDITRPFPGMHVPPIPDIHRTWSHVSVITQSELPSYEAALELMNKETKESEDGGS
ncbi:hypothetical protein Bpfe_029733 [Biomphalaria pfeifferi]|uniref:WxxW domain-containing protein n=1 Tax=Biomphalaria pfeifferi TaxID=112525 RepID=A0AAD8AS37_BIOPF|nr:hypothetical protein Bpfe_029733 [Biomphalaria pfeifferi]